MSKYLVKIIAVASGVFLLIFGGSFIYRNVIKGDANKLLNELKSIASKNTLSLDRGKVLGASLDYEVYSVVLTSDGSYSLLQIIEGKITENGFGGRVTAKMPDGELVAGRLGGSVPEFTLADGKKSIATIVEPALTVLQLKTGEYLALKITKGEVKSGRLTGITEARTVDSGNLLYLAVSGHEIAEGYITPTSIYISPITRLSAFIVLKETEQRHQSLITGAGSKKVLAAETGLPAAGLYNFENNILVADPGAGAYHILGGVGTTGLPANPAVVNQINQVIAQNPLVSTQNLVAPELSYLLLGPGSITTAMLQNASITADKIATGTITADKLAAGVVTSSTSTTTVSDGAITTAKLADSAVTSAKISDGTVTTSDLSSTLSFSSSALLDLSAVTHSSTSQMGLILPNVSSSSPSNPSSGKGYLAYDTADKQVLFYNGTAWGTVGSGTITSVTAGNGLSGGGSSGAISLSINSTDISSCTSSSTQKIIWDSTNNRFTCGTDQTTGGSASSLSSITAALSANTISNGDFAQIWNWSLTTASKTAFKFGESAASTATGTPYILGVSTLTGSTANPLLVTAGGTSNGVKVDTTGLLSAIGTGGIQATTLGGATFAAPGAIGGTTPSTGAFTTLSATGAIAGATTTNTINGLIINSGSLSGISTITTSGAINGATISGGTLSGGTHSGTAISGTGSFTITGGTAANETLTFVSTSNVTKGDIQFFSASNKITSAGALTIAGALSASNFSGSSSGTNTGDQTITLTGDVTGTGTGSFAATIASGAVTLGKMANLAANSIIGNNTGISATPLALTASQVKTLLAIANTDVSGLGTISTQNSNSIAITGGSINGTTVGATTPSTGAFTSLSATTLSMTSYATISASLALGNTNAAGGPGHLNMSGNLTLAGAIAGATATNTINGLIINSGALSGITTVNASGQITSTLATGTAPFVVASTTNVANLNASSLSGATFAAPGAIGGTTPGTGAFTTLSATGAITGATATNTINGLIINSGALSGITTINASGQITSTLATGTAPFVVASTTNVANLNASSLNGATFSAPGAIGGGTPGSGAFTTLSTTSYATVSASLALGNTNAAGGPGHLNMSGNLTLAGAISGATATNTINGLIINSGALSGISTITTSGAINGATISGGNISGGTLSGTALTGTGAFTVNTTGNANGLTLNTATGASGNSGAITIQTGGTSVSGTSGNVTIDVGAGVTSNGTIGIGTANSGTITIGRSTQGITLPGFTGNNAVLYGTTGTGVLAAATTSTSGLCLLSGAATGYVPTWTTCPGGGGSWSQLTAPSADLSLAMAANHTTFTWGGNTGAGLDMFKLTDNATNTGTGYVLDVAQVAGSSAKPLKVTQGANTLIDTTSAGALTLTSAGAATWGTTTGNLTIQVAGAATSANVQIGGGGGGSATPDLLVVDQATGALPAGTNGAIALDSTGKFNIYEGAWKVLCNKTDLGCGTGTGAALSAITAATTGNTINNADNAQVWNWQLTTLNKTAFSFGENVASTATGAPYILGISTLTGSTANPLIVTAGGTANGVKVDTTGLLQAIGTGGIKATTLGGATFAAPGAIGGTTPGTGAFTTLSATGAITGATTTNTINSLVINAGALSGITTINASGQITSTLATGTAPFVVASTTNVANLNASSLNGATFAVPGAIGSTTPGTGVFTTIGVGSATSPQGKVSIADSGLTAIGKSLFNLDQYENQDILTASASGVTKFTVSNAGALTLSGAISGATATNTINGLIINSGALSGVTTINASGQITSTLVTGTAPFVVASTTNVANLNASSLNGATFAAPGAIGGTTPSTGAFTTLSATGAITGATATNTINGLIINSGALSGITTINASGQITSTLATGTAPFVVASTTNVANLNASSLNGATFSAPGAIGGGTPGAGTFTSLSATTLSTTSYATVSASLALGNTNAAAGPGHLNMSGNLTLAGAIAGATATNTINGLIINSGALSGVTTINASGQITSTLATGTAPFVVASTTNVANLNASSLNGATFATPGAIGGGTPGTGAFTTLSASGLISANGGLTLAANQGLTFTSGTGTLTQNYSNTTGTSATINHTNSASTGTNTSTVLSLAITGTANAIGSNTITGLNFPNVVAATNNTYNGITFGTGFNNYITSGTVNLTAAGALSGITTINASGQITSTLATGTAPFVVASTTNVANLNASSLSGATFAAPGAIGGTTPGTGAFTTISASGLINANGGLTLAANQNLTLTSGTGTLTQGYTNSVTGSAHPLTLTNSNASVTAANVKGLDLSLVGATNTNANANTITGINFGNVTPITNNAFNGITFGTGFNNFLTSGTINVTAAGAITGATGVTLASGNFDQSASAGTFSTGTGAVSLNGLTTLAAGKALIITGGAGSPTATTGTVWYDTTANKFKIVENGVVKILCNTTDLACGAGGGSALSGISAATAGNTINNGDNAQVWNWQLSTAAKTAFSFGENIASINGAGSQYILGISTLTGSTANPLIITAGGTANGIKVDTTGLLSAVGTGGIKATDLAAGTYANALTLSSATNSITVGTLTATGGTINSTSVGATTPSTGAFTTLSATGAITGPTATNTINGVIISSGAVSGVTTLSASGLISANGGLTLAANQNLTFTSGTGTLTQNYSNTTGTQTTFNHTNSASTGTNISKVLGLAITGTANALGSNTITGIDFANVVAATNNTYYALSFGTGLTDILRYNGTQIISGTGILQSAGLSGTYSNALTLSGATNSITVGTLTATGGSINGTTVGATTPGTGAFTTLSASGALSANGGLTVAANQGLTFTSGTGTLTQNYSNTTGTSATINHTNSASTGTNTSTVLGLAITGTANALGSNTITGINFPNVVAATNNTYNGITFGTGFNNYLTSGTVNLTAAGALSGITTLGLSGAITGATATNTINGIIINSGAVSSVSTLGLSGAIAGATATNTINGLIINSGALSGATTLGLSGAITGATATNTINGIIINAGAVSGVSTLGLSGAITGATATNTINGMIINAGAVSGVTTLGASSTVTIGSGLNTFTFNPASGPVYAGTAMPTKKVTLTPEYAGATLTGDGTSNTGTMTSDFCSNGATNIPNTNIAVCATSGDIHNYYTWTTTQGTAQDYDIWTEWQVPSDFSAFIASPITYYGWRSSISDSVTLTFYTAAGVTCGTATAIAGTVGQWNNTTYTSTGCTPAAGDVLKVRTQLSVGVSGEFARVGEVTISYSAKF